MRAFALPFLFVRERDQHRELVSYFSARERRHEPEALEFRIRLRISITPQQP